MTEAALERLVGRSAAMEALKAHVARIAPSELRVHVFGETGTGKEEVARALHDLSPRRGGRFVAVNVAGFSDELFSAELFGHAKGAFTGALCARDGYVAKAEGGTLFIDEVADMSPLAQVRLLRFLQEREYQRLGETTPRRADVRVLSATNVDLGRRVQDGRFRGDLLYRLTDDRLVVPPLREREGDVLLLARHFLRSYAAARSVARPTLGPEVQELLVGHPWPGNVRQLQSQMHRLVALAPGREARGEDLSPELTGPGRPCNCLLQGGAAATRGTYPAERHRAPRRGARARRAGARDHAPGPSREAAQARPAARHHRGAPGGCRAWRAPGAILAPSRACREPARRGLRVVSDEPRRPGTWASLKSMTRSWRLASVALLSFSSGLPLGLVWIAIPAWMARAGVDIKVIGLFTLAQAPWSFKLLWSPSMDRFPPPFLGRKRGWILISQVVLLGLGLAPGRRVARPAGGVGDRLAGVRDRVRLGHAGHRDRRLRGRGAAPGGAGDRDRRAHDAVPGGDAGGGRSVDHAGRRDVLGARERAAGPGLPAADARDLVRTGA